MTFWFAKMVTWDDWYWGVVQLQTSSRLPWWHSRADCSHKDGENKTWILSLFFQHILSHIFICNIWHVKCDMWHKTHDIWPDTQHLTPHTRQLTPDIWHLTYDMWWWVNILSKVQPSSSYGLLVMMFWRFGGKGWLADWLNESVTEVFAEQPRLQQAFLKKLCA